MPLEGVALVVNQQGLLYFVQRQMFCRCGCCLDVRRAVEIDVYKGDSIVETLLVCADCYEAAKAKIDEAIAAREGYRVEIIDGRTLEW